VYKIPNHPNGPDLEIIKYTIKPTTTGGNPISVLNTIKRLSRNQKFLIARKVPKGNPIKQEKNKEIKLTFSERSNISNKSLSSISTKSNDCLKASSKIFILILINYV